MGEDNNLEIRTDAKVTRAEQREVDVFLFLIVMLLSIPLVVSYAIFLYALTGTGDYRDGDVRAIEVQAQVLEVVEDAIYIDSRCVITHQSYVRIRYNDFECRIDMYEGAIVGDIINCIYVENTKGLSRLVLRYKTKIEVERMQLE